MSVDFNKIIEEDYKIYVDTCSLMHRFSKEVFFKQIAPTLARFEKKIILPMSVYNELGKKDNANANLIITEFIEQKLIILNKKYDKSYADDTIQAHFLDERLESNLCLITNDRNLSKDVLNLKNSHATNNIKDIKTFYIAKDDILESDHTTSNNRTNNNTVRKNDTNSNKKKFKFKTCTVPKTNDEKLENVIPKINDYIIDNDNNKHYLQTEVGKGGEGSAYLTNTGYICKIYKEGKLTSFKEKKIRLLIDHKIQVEDVCLPKLIALNSQGKFVGYLMKKVDGKEIARTLFHPKIIENNYPSWNKLNLVNVVLSILRKVKNLHKHNIILGDINPSNILIKDENTVYFIDTDSYQIEDYPCPVGMVPFTRQKNHSKKYTDYLRTKNDDIFAVTTFAFMLMLPGKSPYSFSGGGNPKENMKPSNFPYNLQGRGTYNNVPEGRWIYAWSNLPYCIKDKFFSIFRENKQITLEELISAFKEYKRLLITHDEFNKEILPTTFKRLDKDGKVKNDYKKTTCKHCGTSFQTISQSKQKYCENCNSTLFTKCKECGKTFKLNSPKDQSKYCENCKSAFLKKCKRCGKTFKLNSPKDQSKYCDAHRGENIQCISCGNNFFFNDGEKKYYTKNRLEFPKRCPKCRIFKSKKYQNNHYITSKRVFPKNSVFLRNKYPKHRKF